MVDFCRYMKAVRESVYDSVLFLVYRLAFISKVLDRKPVLFAFAEPFLILSLSLSAHI